MVLRLKHVAWIEVDDDFGPGIVFRCRQIVGRTLQNSTPGGFRRRALHHGPIAAVIRIVQRNRRLRKVGFLAPEKLIEL